MAAVTSRLDELHAINQRLEIDMRRASPPAGVADYQVVAGQVAAAVELQGVRLFDLPHPDPLPVRIDEAAKRLRLWVVLSTVGTEYHDQQMFALSHYRVCEKFLPNLQAWGADGDSQFNLCREVKAASAESPLTFRIADRVEDVLRRGLAADRKSDRLALRFPGHRDKRWIGEDDLPAFNAALDSLLGWEAPLDETLPGELLADLGGRQPAIVSAVVEAGGRLPLEDLCDLMKWGSPTGNEWKGACQRIDEKFERFGWWFHQDLGCAVIERRKEVSETTPKATPTASR